ncbi:hypothetical protein B0T22DRAFT_242366 [Podospora appendiculata]|uniref:Uncharacterized protein n=1 Tax=Podospora appendiculata TaxID=314037 RepID=A0AAE1CB41_9PEZI|nr:hypothetical protein B0T22DRAFT_242366 [Podospora appendiculata]
MGFFTRYKRLYRTLHKMSDTTSSTASSKRATVSSSRHKRRGFFHPPRHYTLWYRTWHPSNLAFRDLVVLGLLIYTAYHLFYAIGPIWRLYTKKKVLAVCSCWASGAKCAAKYTRKLWDDHIWALGKALLPWAGVGPALVLFAELVLTRLW